jgi:tRNA pseudouridine55 synthase
MSTDGVLVVDKPIGPTSHDVVSRVRRAMGTRAVGHAGTLDPMASGVLVVLINEATKLSPYLSADDKVYDATIRLGSETDSLDAQGNVTRTCEVPRDLSLDGVRALCASMCGTIQQVAPVISAIKLEGRTLHARTRSGETVQAPTREVLLRSVDVRAVRADEIDAQLDCGKGFYVRSFARDLGVALGSCAHLSALRRVKSGAFKIEQACDFELVNQAAKGDADARTRLLTRVISLEDAAALLPRFDLNDFGTEAIKHGRKVGMDGSADVNSLGLDGNRAVFDTAGRLVAIGAVEAGVLKVMRGFVRK